MAYPVGPKMRWSTQIEFLDGTVISGTDDEDAIERWRRLAAWTDFGAEDRDRWMNLVLDRARVFYGAGLIGISAASSPGQILDSLAAERCILVRRR